jgi:predicted Zn-dependent protease
VLDLLEGGGTMALQIVIDEFVCALDKFAGAGKKGAHFRSVGGWPAPGEHVLDRLIFEKLNGRQVGIHGEARGAFRLKQTLVQNSGCKLGTMQKFVAFVIAWLVLSSAVLSSSQDTDRNIIAKASALFQSGKIKQAEAVLRAASSANPDSAPLHEALGQLLLTEHNYENAVDELALAAQKEPDSREYNFLLAEALIGWKHYGVAAKFLNAVRPKFGTDPQFHYDLGLAYYNSNKITKSQAEFAEALRGAPNFDRAEFMLAACMASSGNSPQAIEMLRKLVKAHPKNAIYWTTLGQILGEAGGDNMREAVRAVRQALVLAPKDENTKFIAATVFTEARDFASARPLLEGLEKADPNVLAVHVLLARVYAHSGERELTRKETQIANELEKKTASKDALVPPEQQSSGPEQR